MRISRVQEILQTVDAICASPDVNEYRIGLTATPWHRQLTYRRTAQLLYPHFVILATDLTVFEARSLEEAS
jgi:hypothetical protein